MRPVVKISQFRDQRNVKSDRRHITVWSSMFYSPGTNVTSARGGPGGGGGGSVVVYTIVYRVSNIGPKDSM